MFIIGERPQHFGELCFDCQHPDYQHSAGKCTHHIGHQPYCSCSLFISESMKILGTLPFEEKFKMVVTFYVQDNPDKITNPSLYFQTAGSTGVLNIPVLMELDSINSIEGWVEAHLPKKSSCRLQSYLVKNGFLKLRRPYWK